MSKMMETDAFTLDGYADEGEWREFARKMETQRDRAVAIIKGVLDWADGIQIYQDALLKRGFEKACDNWDLATTNLPPLDLKPLRDFLAELESK